MLPPGLLLKIQGFSVRPVPIRLLPKFVLINFLLLALLSVAFGAPVASLVASHGPVAVRAGNALRTVSLRASFSPGDVVATGPNGGATILFLDGSQIRLNANSQVEITAPSPTSKGHKSVIRALSGEIWARLRPGGAASTPTAIAGVRGTAFDIRIAPDGTSTLLVLEGQVDYYNTYGAVRVAPNQSSTARPGKAPTPPVTVENPGLIIEWTLELERTALPRELFYVTADRKQAQTLAKTEADPARKAQLLFDAHEFNAALAAFQNLKADEGTGRTLLELGRLEEAEATLQRSNTAAARVTLAWLELERARPVEAQRWAEQVPGDPGARLVLGIAQLRQGGQLDAAEQNLRAALEDPTYKPQGLAWLSLLEAARENTAQSLTAGAEAVRLAPNSALAHGNYALALFYAGDSRLATREARAAAQLDPDSVAARVALGQSLLARGDVAAASREAAQAVALDPQLPAARYLLGVAEASQRDYSHGRRELETALKLAPDYLAAATALARLENASGNESRAIEVITAFQERQGTSPATLSALGLTLFEQGKYKQAIQSLEESVKLNPSSAQAQLDLAKAYLFSNRLRDSLETGQKAVELAPGVAQYHAVLGAIADYNNIDGLAERELRTALVLDPQNALARLLLSVRTTDPRVGINTISQSLLADPSVLRYLAPGGINTEINLAYTRNTERSLPVFEHLEEGKDRRHTVYTSMLHSRLDDKDKPNDRLENTTVAAYGVADIDTNTRILGTATNVREKEGRPGLSYSPLGPEDASATTGGTLLQLAAKHRQGLGNVSVGLIYEPFRIVYHDPDNIAFPFANLFPQLPFITYDRQTYASRSFVPEVRGDWLLNSDAVAPLRLSAGYARQDADIAVVQHVTDGFPSVFLRQGFRSNVGYMQLAQRPTSRLAYTLLLRGDSVDSISERRFNGDFIRIDQHNFYFLPGAVVNYQLDNRTSLRAFANRVRDDVTTVALAPVETRLATEPTAGFRGSNATSRIFELDLERYLGNGNIIKAFAFHSAAKDLQLGGNSQLPVSNAPSVTVNRAKRTGAGVRLERRLSRNLIGSTTFTYSNTSGDAPGELFDGGPAPYHPRLELLATMDYIDPHGNKARVRIRHEGRYYDDSGVAGFPATGRPTFPAKTVVDLLFAKEPSIHTEYYLNLYNIFNTRQELFYGVPGGSQVTDRSSTVRGRGVEVGVSLRF